jgi:hypothetical protein
MKKALIASALALAHLSAFACEPIGWRLVGQKLISVTERLCTYEKNRVQLSIMVNGLCPLSPC